MTCTNMYRAEEQVSVILHTLQRRVTTGKISREMQLTRIMLTEFSGRAILDLVKDFWLDNFQRRTCFFDLRRMVNQLPPDQVKTFHKFISENAKSRAPDTPSEVGSSECSTDYRSLTLSTVSYKRLAAGRGQCSTIRISDFHLHERRIR